MSEQYPFSVRNTSGHNVQKLSLNINIKFLHIGKKY